METALAWSTILGGAVGALVGGAVAAAITARVNVLLAREARRERAAGVLWEYHRTLAGFAAREYDSAGMGDEVVALAEANLVEVREAYRAAYPWAGYLSKEAQAKLFHDAYFQVSYEPSPVPGDTMTADAINTLGNLLRDELSARFPLK